MHEDMFSTSADFLPVGPQSGLEIAHVMIFLRRLDMVWSLREGHTKIKYISRSYPSTIDGHAHVAV